jgi:hypothetical protein
MGLGCEEMAVPALRHERRDDRQLGAEEPFDYLSPLGDEEPFLDVMSGSAECTVGVKLRDVERGDMVLHTERYHGRSSKSIPLFWQFSGNMPIFVKS